MANNNQVISDAQLEAKVKSGEWVACPPDEVEPDVLRRLPFGASFYVTPRVNMSHEKYTQPLVMRTSSGKTIVIIDESMHLWTQEYIRRHIHCATDADIESQIAAGRLAVPENVIVGLRGQMGSQYPASWQRYRALLGSIARMAGDMQVAVPRVLIDVTAERQITTSALAHTTPQRHHFLFIARDYFEMVLQSDKDLKRLTDIIGHEIAHLEKDTLAIAQMHNPVVSRRQELRADLVGAGPLGTHDPLGLANNFREWLRKDYLREHPGADPRQIKDDDLRKISARNVAEHSDPMHPTEWERIVALEYAARLMADYEKKHKVVTRADKQAESDYVVKETFAYMTQNKLWQWPVETVGTPGVKKRTALDGDAPASLEQAAMEAARSARAVIGEGQKPVEIASSLPGAPAAVASSSVDPSARGV